MHIKSPIKIAALGVVLLLAGCGGPSAEEQEKLKQETIQLETTTVEVDSTIQSIQQTSKELDDLLKQLDTPQP
jgi:hypothetical protein